MRLLITTQAVDENDPALAFFCGWLKEFAKHAEQVTVLALRVGAYELPPNVEVAPLRPQGKKGKLAIATRFLSLIGKYKYDAVFVHMNPEYVALGGWYWRLRGIPVALWYTHKSVTPLLRIATTLATVLMTASAESFRLKSKKLQIMGHGIDTERFSYSAPAKNASRLVSIGRIAPAKQIEDLIEAANHIEGATLDLVGAPARAEDQNYEAALKKKAGEQVHFLGPVAYARLPELFPNYDLFLHASRGTGSLDKAPLEAMAAGVPVVSSSEAFKSLLAPQGLFAADSLGSVAKGYLARADKEAVRKALRDEVVRLHSLSSLIPRIIATLGRI